MRKSPLRKKSLTKVSTLKSKLWNLCKLIIRTKHGNVCYTCSRSGLVGINWHTGHLWPKASLGAHLKYDLRVLRPQCYNCNINLGGQGAVFFERMTREIGIADMDELKKEKQILVDADQTWYENKISVYEEILENL